jgi:hypothetical protein
MHANFTDRSTQVRIDTFGPSGCRRRSAGLEPPPIAASFLMRCSAKETKQADHFCENPLDQLIDDQALQAPMQQILPD